MNIRSLSKNFDNLLDILRDSNYSFNILCITETWCTDSTLKSNSNLHLPNFDLISQERKRNKRGGGVLIYIPKRLKCNLRNDLSVSDKDKEILTIEVSRENDKKHSPKLLLQATQWWQWKPKHVFTKQYHRKICFIKKN